MFSLFHSIIRKARSNATGRASLTLATLTGGILFALSTTACTPADGAQELKVGDVTVTERPDRAPRELKDYFYYPEARIVLSSVYMAGSFLSTPEGAVIYETDDTAEDVVKHYEKVIEDENWTVIQTVDTPEEKLIMAESRFRKIVTVIVRGKGGEASPARIKIYFKRSDSE